MPRIIVTGGSGKAGRHVIPYLISKGHTVLNLDLIPFPDPSVDVYTLKVDLTDSGQVFNALTSLFSLNEFEVARPGPPRTPHAVIHLAAYARNMLVPDNQTFASNTQSTYNIIEASSKLGINKVIIASSETTYGVCFAQGDKDWHQFPLEEDYPVDPADSYALSKLVGELTAKTFNIRQPDMDIYALRIGNVIEPHEYAQDFPGYLKHPEGRKRNAWSYIDARDLGQICDLCVQKDGLGFQVFNATNDTITTLEPTAEVLAKYYPNVKLTRELGEWEGPLSNRKIREVLGFKDVHNWRDYVDVEKVKAEMKQ